jgi:hypothetical protein
VIVPGDVGFVVEHAIDHSHGSSTSSTSDVTGTAKPFRTGGRRVAIAAGHPLLNPKLTFISLVHLAARSRPDDSTVSLSVHIRRRIYAGSTRPRFPMVNIETRPNLSAPRRALSQSSQ